MSGAANPTAQIVKERAAAWLEKRMGENWSDAQQAELDSWLQESPAHKLAYWRLDAAWNRTERLAALRSPLLDEAIPAEPSRVSPLLLRLAAGFAVAAVLGTAAANFLLAPQERIFQTPVGGHETISFADGSRIELNTDTVLRTHMTTQERVVWLDKGEAFFRVKHDATHPLIVIAGNQRITDLGTQFLVRRDGSALKVALLEGRVRLGSTNLAPGDEAIATANSVIVSRRSVEELTNEIAWRNGVLVFRHATLADAVKAFNRYSDRKMVVPDPAIGRRTVGGTFRTNDVEGFTAVVQDLLGLRVANEGNQIVIGR